jgi:AraC-like DNA-binding protein
MRSSASRGELPDSRAMSTTTDTFARFVDVLGATLDDHEVSGEALAARLHLSRFHFDRLVSAASGEPPRALRRRVLLERAAYRLVTTDDDVLRVALEAGYSSHEAFTRAFARAYGQAPSRWRHHPTRIEIGAPSRVHFHPPGTLRRFRDRDFGERPPSTSRGASRFCGRRRRTTAMQYWGWTWLDGQAQWPLPFICAVGSASGEALPFRAVRQAAPGAGTSPPSPCLARRASRRR